MAQDLMMASTPAAKPAAKRAYATLMAGEGDYYDWKGVTGLAMGLRKVGSAYPLVVAVLPDVPEPLRRVLVSHGCVVREVEPVRPPQNQVDFAMAPPYRVVGCYSRLRIWELVEYERIVYLDPHVQVVENIDALFELKEGLFYAVSACHDEAAAAARLAAGLGGRRLKDVFVLEPSRATAEALLDALRVTAPTAVVEQDLLNMFVFKDRYKAIPLESGLVLAMLLTPPVDVELDGVKAVKDCAPRRWTAARLLAATAGVLGRQDRLPAMATLAAASAAVGVVNSAADPAICFGFYTLFMAAIGALLLALADA